MPAPVFVNGKFTAQRTTGGQRVARQLVQALDALDLPGHWELLVPPGADAPPLRRLRARVVPGPRVLHLWEQWTLPRAARGGLLLNLGGTAPWAGRRQAMLIHDAAVFDEPQAYTRPFVAWYRALYTHAAPRALRLYTVSQFSRARLGAALGLSAERFTVLLNGADHLDGVVPERGVLDGAGLRGQPFLLAVGSANPTKNLDALVKAFAARPAGPLRLVIAGGANERVFAGGAAVADPPNVLRTGPVSDAELVALYSAAVALVFPSLYEGFGLPPLEAMRLGCPVLAARAAAVPEVCGDAALYFDPRDGASIVSAIDRVVGDDALRAGLRAAGQRRAAGFTWHASAVALAASLENLV